PPAPIAPAKSVPPTSGRLVSGSLVLSTMRFVATRFGERALKRVLDSLPEEIRPHFVRGITADSWIPFSALVDLAQQVDAQLGRDDLTLIAQCGRAAADAAEEALRATAAKPVPPELLVAELPRVAAALMTGVELRVR